MFCEGGLSKYSNNNVLRIFYKFFIDAVFVTWDKNEERSLRFLLSSEIAPRSPLCWLILAKSLPAI
jgi:hypothetical protein